MNGSSAYELILISLYCVFVPYKYVLFTFTCARWPTLDRFATDGSNRHLGTLLGTCPYFSGWYLANNQVYVPRSHIPSTQPKLYTLEPSPLARIIQAMSRSFASSSHSSTS